MRHRKSIAIIFAGKKAHLLREIDRPPIDLDQGSGPNMPYSSNAPAMEIHMSNTSHTLREELPGQMDRIAEALRGA